jgi:Zn finger protein HypA/HybF involved in hydrogenase expression
MGYSVKVGQPSFVIFFQLEDCFDVLGNGAMLNGVRCS